MGGKYLAAAALALLIGICSHAGAAEKPDPAKAPPIIPATDEVPILGIPAFSIHQELERCLSDAATLLGKENDALHVRIGTPQRFYSPTAGFVLRADFTRDDVLPPLINRIVCWHTGQLIASRISAPPLSAKEREKTLAVPHANPHQN